MSQLPFLLSSFPSISFDHTPTLLLKDAVDLCIGSLGEETAYRLLQFIKFRDCINKLYLENNRDISLLGFLDACEIEENSLAREYFPKYLFALSDNNALSLSEKLFQMQCLFFSSPEHKAEERVFQLELEVDLVILALESKQNGSKFLEAISFYEQNNANIDHLNAVSLGLENLSMHEELEKIVLNDQLTSKDIYLAILRYKYDYITEDECLNPLSEKSLIEYVYRLAILEKAEVLNKPYSYQHLSTLVAESK